LIFGFDEFEFDLAALQLARSGTPIKADAKVLRLLAALLRNAGELLTKQELVRQVWDDL
jgi:non-specific serine/threonine protein kinase